MALDDAITEGHDAFLMVMVTMIMVKYSNTKLMMMEMKKTTVRSVPHGSDNNNANNYFVTFE